MEMIILSIRNISWREVIQRSEIAARFVLCIPTTFPTLAMSRVMGYESDPEPYTQRKRDEKSPTTFPAMGGILHITQLLVQRLDINVDMLLW